jgi:polyisoprenyl-teichoic acid--peptidoglycan teichoic acid transferase
MSLPTEGEQPGGERNSEGRPQEPEAPEEVHGDLPDLAPEFMQALGEAAGPADPEPESGGGSGDRGPDTVEFTPQEAAEVEQPTVVEPPAEVEQPAKDGGGEDKPVRTVVIPSTPAPPLVSRPSTDSVLAPPEPGVPRKPSPQGDFEQPPRRKRLWLRFLIASLLIVVSMASATSASVLLYFDDIANKIGHGLPGVKKQLLPPESGEPENILILGSDRRASLPGTKGLSDTTILLRLDPDNNAIALMSIPRDLKTYVPGVGITKFNEAYAYGGPKLTVRVVKRITHMPINHVVNVDFLGFARAVNAIGCVYIDVDRRYYHSNVGLPPSEQYAEINIQPGYQKLCGKDALQYVRYRHTDTDLVRSARQQDFLREARQQVPASDLFFSKRKELIDIFTSYTTSDISSGETMLQVLKLFVASRNAPIKEIHFPAVLHPRYVTAQKSAVASAVKRFEGIEASGGPRGSLELPSSSGNTGIVPEERKRARAKRAKQQGKAPLTPSPGNDGLVDASQGSREVAATAAAKTLRSFPVFYPRRLPAAAVYAQPPRVYHLRDTDQNSRGAYKMVLQLPQGDYFGVQGIHGWSDPPILNDPSESRTMRGRDYDIFLDGDRIRLISWHQGDNSYWISNSLLQTLTNDQMLGMARSIGKLPGERHPKKKKAKKRHANKKR